MKDTKFTAMFFLVMGILNFLLLVYDVFNDYDAITYYWLFCTIILLGTSLRLFIKYDIEKLINKE